MPILFLIFWIVLNGRITPDVVVVGVAATALVSVVTYKLLGVGWQNERRVWGRISGIIGYLLILVVEVFKANIHMIVLILSPTIEIKPQLIYFKSPVRTNAAKVALANSITLTPGTITIKLDEEGFGVHAIDSESGYKVEASVFVERLKKIEGGHGRG